MLKVQRFAALILFSASLLIGCKSAERVMFRTPMRQLSTQLPALEVAVDNGPMAMTEGALVDDPMRVFKQEVDKNLISTTDSAKFGYAKLLIVKAEPQRTGRFFQAMQMATFMVPSLLGIPVEYCRTNVTAEVQILNALGDTVGVYHGAGRSKVRVAMYHGYSQSQAPRLADMQALRLALDQIRPQLENDVDSLRQQLLTSGPISTPITVDEPVTTSVK